MFTILVISWTQLETSLGAVARTKSFVETTPLEEQGEPKESLSYEWPTTGSISFNDVCAKYGDDKADMVLKNISLKILPGEKIGICGRSGRYFHVRPFKDTWEGRMGADDLYIYI